LEYNEVYKDLFTVDKEYFLAHCISADAKMGAGIAVEFRKRFKLGQFQKEVEKTGLIVGSCAMVGRVLNLVTKRVYWGKPTYETFTKAVEDMKRLAVKHDIKKIAMPQIGAGLDKLSWAKNREIIKEIFSDTDIEILVCRFK